MRIQPARFFMRIQKRQTLKQMKAIKKTQKYFLGIALALLVVYPASVFSQIAVYDFTSDDEGFTVETVGAVPGPWSIMKEMDSGSQKAVWPVAGVHTTISLAARIALFPPPAR